MNDMKPHSAVWRMGRRLVSQVAPCLMAACLMSVAGCRKEASGTAVAADSEILVTVGDSSLTKGEVLRRIPAGTAPGDSAALFASVVDSWLKKMLLLNIAAENLPDMERIDRMADDYRNRLIIEAYREAMLAKAQPRIGRDSVEAYWRRFSDDMRLERPLVRGIYIKVPSDGANIDDVRHWVANPTQDNIDRLEKYGLREAMQYDYFVDRWVDWQTVADQIPYRFYDPDAFVRSTVNFETTYGGSTYFLHITSYIKSGDVMPLEFAEPVIRETLAGYSRNAYERKMLRDLYNKAVRDGRLSTPGYDPVKHQPKTSPVK